MLRQRSNSICAEQQMEGGKHKRRFKGLTSRLWQEYRVAGTPLVTKGNRKCRKRESLTGQ